MVRLSISIYVFGLKKLLLFIIGFLVIAQWDVLAMEAMEKILGIY
jgi:hypothetical protein